MDCEVGWVLFLYRIDVRSGKELCVVSFLIVNIIFWICAVHYDQLFLLV